jgi:hypothetical protein
MRKNIQEAFNAFSAGRQYTGGKNTISVRGKVIFSYAMPIAWRNDDGTISVTTQAAPSQTTRCHLNGIRRLLAG